MAWEDQPVYTIGYPPLYLPQVVDADTFSTELRSPCVEEPAVEPCPAAMLLAVWIGAAAFGLMVWRVIYLAVKWLYCAGVVGI